MHGETCTDEVNVSEQESQKIGMRTCSKTQKYSIAHNFFNFDRNIGMLHLVSIILMRGIQLKKNKELHILWFFLWYNINCIFEILQQIHQKALQIQEKNSSA